MLLRELFLKEDDRSVAVFAFGRFNPPTIGHQKLLSKVLDTATELNGKGYVFLSQKQNNKTDPLSFEQKQSYIQKFYPSLAVGDANANTIIKALQVIQAEGRTRIIMVAGSDRVDEFEKLLNQYNGKPDKQGNDLYKFDSIDVVSAGERDPDQEGASGASASKARELANKGQEHEFTKIIMGGIMQSSDVALDTMPRLLARNVAEFGDSAAYREKDLGIWQTWTWKEASSEVMNLARGLIDLGIKEGDHVAVIGRNRPYLYWSLLAIQHIGAVPVPLYQDAVAEEMEFKHIKTRNGMSERMWVRNCVSIGLSGAFIEPLESNGLMSIHEFLLVFCNIAEGKDTLNSFDAHSFNHVCREQFLYFADFITLHYAMTARNDTAFWHDIQMQDFTDSPLLKQVYDIRGGSFWNLPDTLTFENLNATLYMIAGHKINPYTQVKLSNMKFWDEGFNIKTENLGSVIQRYNEIKKGLQFPSAVEYYGNYHR
mgnify:CR=1 FL=1